ncbi:hypothetical protein HanHA300_Chr15g0580091 [Helianthus annuus]|nr:hypothetical protein HanHA300_Chr15g0580091 [Helianthus annuus]KAJ0474443.1 hypothetical protein HanHA89_Chr15g0629781 [Helianthus annuus]KAJ0650001.1 hypothetical protein HanLR1_Chr15g0590711 [Helianthus annuus]
MPSVNSCANNSPISRFCCNRVPQGRHRLPTVRSNKEFWITLDLNFVMKMF